MYVYTLPINLADLLFGCMLRNELYQDIIGSHRSTVGSSLDQNVEYKCSIKNQNFIVTCIC